MFKQNSPDIKLRMMTEIKCDDKKKDTELFVSIREINLKKNKTKNPRQD